MFVFGALENLTCSDRIPHLLPELLVLLVYLCRVYSVDQFLNVVYTRAHAQLKHLPGEVLGVLPHVCGNRSSLVKNQVLSHPPARPSPCAVPALQYR